MKNNKNLSKRIFAIALAFTILTYTSASLSTSAENTANKENTNYNTNIIYKQDLKVQLDIANKENKNNYYRSENHWNKFETVLKQSQEVYNNSNATQEQVNSATQNLKNSIFNLKSKYKLAIAIDKANSLNASDYTSSSWFIVKTRLNEALQVYNNDNSTIQEINNVEYYLHTAINNLKKQANKKFLKEQIDKAKALNKNDYTVESWEKFERILNHAISVYNSSNIYDQSVIDNATNNLKNAMAHLLISKDTVEKSHLKTQIDIANSLNHENYTDTSWNVFKNALEQAENVYNNSNATQDQVNFATQNLKNAIQQLQSKPQLPQVNKQELKNTIDHANTLNPNDYTNDSWATFKNALEQAENVYNNSNATQDQINSVTQNLKNAINSLASIVYKDYLKSEINKAESINSDNYIIDEAWENLQNKLKEAKNILSNPHVSQYQVNIAESDLNNAIKSINEKAYKEYLKEIIDKANKLDSDNYTNESWTNLQNNLSKAIETYNNPNSTQYEVDMVQMGLDNAIRSLQKKVNKDRLKNLIDQANNLNINEYTSYTWQNLEIALLEVVQVYNNPNAYEYQVYNATSMLENAIRQLEYKPNKKNLKNLIDFINNSNLNPNDYIESSWKRLEYEIEIAKSIYNNSNATQYMIDMAQRDIESALMGLEKRPNKQQLKNLIDSVSKLNYSDYTIESWRDLQISLDFGKSVYNDANSTQTDVDIALNYIQSEI